MSSLNGAISSRKCSIKEPAKWINSVYVLTEICHRRSLLILILQYNQTLRQVLYNCVMHFYSKQDWSCKKYLSRYELTYPKMDKICQIQYILPRIFWISTISPFCSTDFTLKETLKNTQPFVKFSPISLSSLLWQFLDFPSKWNRCIKRGKRVGIQNLLTILRNEFARGIKVCIA